MNEEGVEEKLHLCHRLDSATSGLIVGCLDHDLAKIIRKKFANREVSKSYLAIASGFLAVTRRFMERSTELRKEF